MKKYKLQTLLKVETANTYIPCRDLRQELLLTYQNKINYVSSIINEEILFKANNFDKLTFINPLWKELTEFAVIQIIVNSFLDYVYPREYIQKLELFKILKAQYIEERLHNTRHQTRYANVCLVKSSIKALLNSKGQMIGTSGKLKINDFEIETEDDANNQYKIDTKDDLEVIRDNNHTYIEALINLEKALETFDGEDECYAEILSILRLTYQPSRIYICEHKKKPSSDKLVINQKAQWQDTAILSSSNGVSLENKSVEEIFPSLADKLLRGKLVWSNIAEVSLEEKAFFEARGIASILLLPIILKGNFIGFIGLEYCLIDKALQSTEINFLQAIAGVISLAYKNLLTEKSLRNDIKKCQIINSELKDEVNQRTIELHQEIAKHQCIQKELEESLSLQKTTLETTTDGILLVDSKGCIAGYNHKLVEMWGIPQRLMTSGKYAQVIEFVSNQLKNPEEFFISASQLETYPSNQIYDWIEFKDGRIFERYSQPQYIGSEIVGRVWSFRDISERFRAEAKIQHQANHDLLTNLPNRMQFYQRLLGSLIKASQSKSKLAVCFLDLDRFKTINETLGHKIGDKLLQSVARRLNTCVRSCDTIARWGGDEFTLLLSEIEDTRDAARIAEEILKVLKPAFLIDNHVLHVSASIGIAVYLNHGKDGETLIKNADAALNRAKLQGRNNYQIYNSTINSQASELLSLENSLHYALERDELKLYYQPQVDITTGEIQKFEALLRWQHPKFGLISPSKFIPIAEETGLIVPISEWVLKAACAQAKDWQKITGSQPVRVAVNLSPRQFQQPDLVETVRRILAENQLSPQYLELEITESAAMQNVDFSTKILTELYDMGVSISIDDFGTGYCSFNYLKQFPIHCLKIDRSFVKDLTNDTNDAAIITAMIALAHGLNFSVVAEGVETEEQRNLLRILECESMQGNLFSPAVCDREATELLLKSKSRLINTSVLAA
ncbi:EAL domain-containing protein [Rivularia sp. PCC 7116]|uniref:bifunctional diguanylate cyclase/phosphodiesterase n=1 Tax=Rivularia sp. PCC 7116 TaxID=373994 RepID=UPI0003036552|nr:EAL domain-containing protein [Rivularia sp. PCC 7116]